MKADAIIFDKDGTLIDFDAFWVPLTVKAVEAVLIKTNMKSAPMDRILEAFGISDGITSIEGVLCKGTYRQMGEIMHAILSEYGYNGSADELTALLINAYNESTDAGEIKPTCTELAEALTKLKKQNKRLAVVTTDNREITEKCLKALGIAELFDRIYTGTAIAMPSGILCNAMVKAIGMPNVGFSKKLINVINPSGRLWMVKIRKVINPMCCKLD